MPSRVAALVDGDNISADHSSEILSVAMRFGRLDITRVYADACRSPKWSTDCRFRLVHAGCGKNASDILLVIDAMEIALTQEIEVFVVATSDSDFTHLVRRLREIGRKVIGLGKQQTTTAFRTNCTEFLQLSCARPVSCARPADIAPTEVLELDRHIRKMIAVHSQNGKGMALANLAPKMHVQHRVRISSFKEGSWRAYLEARPSLYDLDPRGPNAMVRFLPDGFSSGARV